MHHAARARPVPEIAAAAMAVAAMSLKKNKFPKIHNIKCSKKWGSLDLEQKSSADER